MESCRQETDPVQPFLLRRVHGAGAATACRSCRRHSAHKTEKTMDRLPDNVANRIWLQQYPEGIPPEVDVKAYASLKEIVEKSCARFADLPAYGNMGVSITYRELDEASRAFGAYLQKVVGLKR